MPYGSSRMRAALRTGLTVLTNCVWVLTYAIWVQQDEGGPALGLDRVKLCVWVLTYAIWA